MHTLEPGEARDKLVRRTSPAGRWLVSGGSFEAQGIDYDRRDGTLRVIVMSPSVRVLFDSKTWRFARTQV